MRLHHFRYRHHGSAGSHLEARLLAICRREQDAECDLPKARSSGRDGDY